MTYTKDEMTRMQIGMRVCIYYLSVLYIIRLLCCCSYDVFHFWRCCCCCCCFFLVCVCMFLFSAFFSFNFFIVLGRNSIDSTWWLLPLRLFLFCIFILLFTSWYSLCDILLTIALDFYYISFGRNESWATWCQHIYMHW